MSDAAQHLLKSNAIWAKKVSEEDPCFFPDSAKGQSPHTLWIGCSDSRVPESVITASKPGDIFVQRNIANRVPSDDKNVLSVLSYAVEHLGVENVIVVGHSKCGGADASLKAAEAPGFVPKVPITTIGSEPCDSPLNRWLEPLTLLAYSLPLPKNHEAALDLVVRENVKAQVDTIEKVIKCWKPLKKSVVVHGWFYDLATGRLSDLCISRCLD